MITMLEYDEWYDKNEDELMIEYKEGGHYLDTDMEEWIETKYEEYSNQFN